MLRVGFDFSVKFLFVQYAFDKKVYCKLPLWFSADGLFVIFTHMH